ncbi:MAG: beta-class carbonic anhydrase [Acidimicrobiales bacterium]
MAAIDELLARHTASLTRFTPPSVLSPRPRLRVAVVTCMDARIDLFQGLGLKRGDVHLLRNAGGLVTDDVVRSLVLSQRQMGTTEVMVVQHTDCGLFGLRDADLLGRVTAETELEPPFTFGGFDDLDASVRHSLKRLRDCPWLPARQFARGFVYDVDTGALREVV